MRLHCTTNLCTTSQCTTSLCTTPQHTSKADRLKQEGHIRSSDTAMALRCGLTALLLTPAPGCQLSRWEGPPPHSAHPALLWGFHALNTILSLSVQLPCQQHPSCSQLCARSAGRDAVLTFQRVTVILW